MLLLLEPLLLQTSQRSQTRVHGAGLAMAWFAVHIGAAMRAQSPAITAADDLHGENQEHLFGKNVAQKHSFALKKSHFRIFVLQPYRFFFSQFFCWAIEKIEIACYFLG